jgi:predicted DNA-binding transcriptional regulator AlpA
MSVTVAEIARLAGAFAAKVRAALADGRGLWTAAEAAAGLGMHPRSFRKLYRKAGFPAPREAGGKARRWDAGELKAWLAGRRLGLRAAGRGEGGQWASN